MNPLGGDKELSDLLDFSAVGKLQKYRVLCGSTKLLVHNTNSCLRIPLFEILSMQMFSPPGSMVGSKSSGSLTDSALPSSLHTTRTGACVIQMFLVHDLNFCMEWIQPVGPWNYHLPIVKHSRGIDVHKRGNRTHFRSSILFFLLKVRWTSLPRGRTPALCLPSTGYEKSILWAKE